MHEKDIVHLDIKLENILVDENFNVKLADFGFATDVNIENLTLFRGSTAYMAPEIWGTESYDGRKADIFSMGVVIFTMVVGYQPFDIAKPKDKDFKLFLDGNLDQFWEQMNEVNNLSVEFKDLLSSMLDPCPNRRPSILQIKNHPWMKRQHNHEAIRDMLLNQSRAEREECDNNTSKKSELLTESEGDQIIHKVES